MAITVAGALIAGITAVLFAKLCDASISFHRRVLQDMPLLAYAALPVAFIAAAWATLRLAPAAAGSGIPQVIAAAEQGAEDGRDARVSMKTAGVKMLLTACLLACGAAVGREGPTVQVAAAVLLLCCSHLRGGASRRALLIAGGAAGVAAAFNTLIAGVVFAVEELAKGFDRRSNGVIILVVVVAGAASYALAGNYAYFGNFNGVTKVAAAWVAAPVVGVLSGLAGGVFARILTSLIGPKPGVVGRFRARRPLVFAGACGMAASAAAWASGGLSFGAGYDVTRRLLVSLDVSAAPAALWRWVATLAASASGAPGGLFAPSLAVGGALGAAVHELWPALGGRELVVLGMAGYLAGVVQAPLTSAIILMEMTRDPGLVGPLMLCTLISRATSSRIMREPLYHVLANAWRVRPEPGP